MKWSLVLIGPALFICFMALANVPGGLDHLREALDSQQTTNVLKLVLVGVSAFILRQAILVYTGERKSPVYKHRRVNTVVEAIKNYHPEWNRW